MSFSVRLWAVARPIYEEILHHPFNRELKEGTLCSRKFHFYMQQDAYYLIKFAEVLTLIAQKCLCAETRDTLLQYSKEALDAERELHAHFITPDYDPKSLRLSPACRDYTQHLISTATTGTAAEGMAAVLPCFWIYREVGIKIAEQSKPDNPYAAWIATYSCQEFHASTDKAISLIDKMAAGASEEIRVNMIRIFKKSARHEWCFWNDSYHLTTL